VSKRQNKTQPTAASVDNFIQGVKDPRRHRDCLALIELMRKVTGEEPEMWGSSMVGFGKYHYKYASGYEGDYFITGFSPRKDSLTLYLMPGFDGRESLLAKLGRHKTGKGCLYLKTLDDVHLPTLTRLIRQCTTDLKRMYPS
jgi:hypothetical protein